MTSRHSPSWRYRATVCVRVCVRVYIHVCISLGLTRPVVSLVRKWEAQLKLGVCTGPQAVVNIQYFLFVP